MSSFLKNAQVNPPGAIQAVLTGIYRWREGFFEEAMLGLRTDM